MLHLRWSYYYRSQVNRILKLHQSKLRQLIDSLSIREKIPQIEVAVGDDVSVLLFRILDNLSPTDEKLLKQFVDNNQNTEKPCHSHVQIYHPSGHTCHDRDPENLGQLQVYLQPQGIDSIYLFYPTVNAKQLSYSLQNLTW